MITRWSENKLTEGNAKQSFHHSNKSRFLPSSVRSFVKQACSSGTALSKREWPEIMGRRGPWEHILGCTYKLCRGWVGGAPSTSTCQGQCVNTSLLEEEPWPAGLLLCVCYEDMDKHSINVSQGTMVKIPPNPTWGTNGFFWCYLLEYGWALLTEEEWLRSCRVTESLA